MCVYDATHESHSSCNFCCKRIPWKLSPASVVVRELSASALAAHGTFYPLLQQQQARDHSSPTFLLSQPVRSYKKNFDTSFSCSFIKKWLYEKFAKKIFLGMKPFEQFVQWFCSQRMSHHSSKCCRHVPIVSLRYNIRPFFTREKFSN